MIKYRFTSHDGHWRGSANFSYCARNETYGLTYHIEADNVVSVRWWDKTFITSTVILLQVWNEEICSIHKPESRVLAWLRRMPIGGNIPQDRCVRWNQFPGHTSNIISASRFTGQDGSASYCSFNIYDIRVLCLVNRNCRQTKQRKTYFSTSIRCSV